MGHSSDSFAITPENIVRQGSCEYLATAGGGIISAGTLRSAPPEMKSGSEVYERSCGTHLGRNCLPPWANEVVANGTFMRGLDKVEDMSRLEPGKLHELTLVLVVRGCLLGTAGCLLTCTVRGFQDSFAGARRYTPRLQSISPYHYPTEYTKIARNLCSCGSDFHRFPKDCEFFFTRHDARSPLRLKVASEQRFLCD